MEIGSATSTPIAEQSQNRTEANKQLEQKATEKAVEKREVAHEESAPQESIPVEQNNPAGDATSIDIRV